jgi:D-serine deaminase-like pyridoxal phosphate-dependent protein
VDNTTDNWYLLQNAAAIDSPALIIYKERVMHNISSALSMVNADRLRPHVKTNKCPDAVKLLLDAGIHKFKCATIAEAEMLAIISAPDVLLAYQPVGPKLERFIALINKYSATDFSCLVDNEEAASQISAAGALHDIVIPVFIDLNTGMNRTGICPENALRLYFFCKELKNIKVTGLHAYDGHLRDEDILIRTEKCNKAFAPVMNLRKELIKDNAEIKIIAGGSPTFPIHATRNHVECSPGTFIYWDRNYQQTCREQPFIPAALVLARIISFPGPGKICIDLGHKSIAAENEIHNRVHFINAPGLNFTGQSEEHLVADVPADHCWRTGDILYGIPFHICPTVALYERALIAEGNKIIGEWMNIARDRKITI